MRAVEAAVSDLKRGGRVADRVAVTAETRQARRALRGEAERKALVRLGLALASAPEVPLVNGTVEVTRTAEIWVAEGCFALELLPAGCELSKALGIERVAFRVQGREAHPLQPLLMELLALRQSHRIPNRRAFAGRLMLAQRRSKPRQVIFGRSRGITVTTSRTFVGQPSTISGGTAGHAPQQRDGEQGGKRKEAKVHGRWECNVRANASLRVTGSLSQRERVMHHDTRVRVGDAHANGVVPEANRRPGAPR